MNGYLRHLANFAHVVRAGSVTAAANKLEVSPSSISASLKILESHFKRPLVERLKAGVRPTDFGLEIYGNAAQIVDALAGAMERPEEEALAGRVTVSLPHELLSGWLAPRIARLTRAHPDITLVLRAEDEVADHTKFARDLYVRVSMRSDDPGLQVLQSVPIGIVMVAHPDLLGGRDPDRIGDITGLPLLVAPRTKSDFVFNASGIAPIRFTRFVQADSPVSRVALAREGAGVVACLEPTVADDIAAGRLVRVLPADFAPRAHARFGTPRKRPRARVSVVAAVLAGVETPAAAATQGKTS